MAFAFAGHSFAALEFVGREAHRDTAGVTDRLFRVLDGLAEQPHAILEASTLYVGSLVVAARKEVHRHREAMGDADVEDVEADLLRAQDRIAVPASIIADIREVHCTGLHGGISEGYCGGARRD